MVCDAWSPGRSSCGSALGGCSACETAAWLRPFLRTWPEANLHMADIRGLGRTLRQVTWSTTSPATQQQDHRGETSIGTSPVGRRATDTGRDLVPHPARCDPGCPQRWTFLVDSTEVQSIPVERGFIPSHRHLATDGPPFSATAPSGGLRRGSSTTRIAIAMEFSIFSHTNGYGDVGVTGEPETAYDRLDRDSRSWDAPACRTPGTGTATRTDRRGFARVGGEPPSCRTDRGGPA